MACPLGQLFKMQLRSLVGKGQAAGEEHGGGAFVPGSVFVVTHQRVPPAGKLHPDLVAPAGVEPEAHQAGVLSRQSGKFQSGGLYSLPLPFDNKNLVFLRILP